MSHPLARRATPSNFCKEDAFWLRWFKRMATATTSPRGSSFPVMALTIWATSPPEVWKKSESVESLNSSIGLLPHWANILLLDNSSAFLDTFFRNARRVISSLRWGVGGVRGDKARSGVVVVVLSDRSVPSLSSFARASTLNKERAAVSTAFLQVLHEKAPWSSSRSQSLAM